MATVQESLPSSSSSNDTKLSECEDQVNITVAESAISFDSVTGKPFPDHVIQALESFYRRGLVGWGKSHSTAFCEALHITGLTDAQQKVRFAFLCSSYFECTFHTTWPPQ